MRLVEQWQELEAQLPEGWSSARLSLALAEDADPDRAALILASLTPGRTGPSFRLVVHPGLRPGNVFSRLDDEGIRGRLDARGAAADLVEEPPAPERHPVRAPLALQWDELAAGLPADWSDLYAEIELDSSDYVPRGALLLAPLNPALFGGATVLRFRCASEHGYGTAPQMARRCLERLDAEAITGTLRPLRALSHTSLAATQGPVWRVGGRSV